MKKCIQFYFNGKFKITYFHTLQLKKGRRMRNIQKPNLSRTFLQHQIIQSKKRMCSCSICERLFWWDFDFEHALRLNYTLWVEIPEAMRIEVKRKPKKKRIRDTSKYLSVIKTTSTIWNGETTLEYPLKILQVICHVECLVIVVE